MLHVKVSANTLQDTECRPTCKSRGRPCPGVRHLAIVTDDGSKVALLASGNGCDRVITAQTAIITITGLQKSHECHTTIYDDGKPTWMAVLAGPQAVWHWRMLSIMQSRSPVYHTWLVRPLSCTVKKLSAVTLPTEPPMTMFKARAAWDNKVSRDTS
jgi:hypothetical protein